MVRSGSLWPVGVVLLGCAPSKEAPAKEAPAKEAPATIATAAASAAVAATAIPAVDGWGVPEWPSAPAAPATGERIYSRVRHLWVRPAPNSQGWLGYLSLGDSVRVKGRAATGGDGRCAWYEIEPKGFVCVGEDATLDASDPTVVELARLAADARSPWPYRYGESIGAPVYVDAPSRADQRRTELELDAHLERVGRARDASDEARRALDPSLVGIDLSPAGKAPPPRVTLGPAGRTLSRRVVRGSTVAYADAFDLEGRSWLVTWDHGLVPKDKVRPFAESRFKGVILGEEGSLPIAFFRSHARARYRREGERFVAAGEWPRLAWTELTGASADAGGVRYLEARSGDWCAERDTTVAAATSPPPLLERRGGRRTWLDVSIHGGTLVAYEGDRPVYATLVSPGRGGTPLPGIPPLETASTPTGTFSVVGKFLTATMVSSSISTLVHAEVQYTQNFDGPYALHGAYWHDAWGEKKSGGCVNLSPIDSRRLFRWTEPALPDGWHGMRTYEDFGPPTLVVLRP